MTTVGLTPEVLVVLGALLLGFVAGYWFGRKDSAQTARVDASKEAV